MMEIGKIMISQIFQSTPFSIQIDIKVEHASKQNVNKNKLFSRKKFRIFRRHYVKITKSMA